MSAHSPIESLEVKLAYQEQTLSQLGDTVYRQQQELERLAEIVERLIERVRTLAEQDRTMEEVDERPPHY